MISGSNFRTGAFLLLGSPHCLLMICGRGWHVLFIHDACVVTFGSRGSLDSCGHYARRTLMAPLPVAVQSGPFVWKWVYIHLPSKWLCLFPSLSLQLLHTHTHTHTHTHRLAKLEATNMQLQQRASRWCGSPSVGHVGRYLAWAAMVVRAHYASICWTSAPSVGVSDWGMLPHNNM